ncbi:MAG: SIS domain-containing protein, partial [Asticcacaulis sp.]
MSSETAINSGRRVLLAGAEALTHLADDLAGALGPVFAAAVETLRTRPGRVILTGVGKSGHVARKIAATLASTGTPALFVHATEASHGDLGMISTDDAVIALSRSGETRELSDVTAYCKRFGIPLIGITAVATSALGRASDYLLLLPPHTEATEGVDAPTTSTTLQIAMGDALAVAL